MMEEEIRARQLNKWPATTHQSNLIKLYDQFILLLYTIAILYLNTGLSSIKLSNWYAEMDIKLTNQHMLS